MNTEFNVYPNLKKTITLVKAKISVYEYKIFEYGKISCILFDESDNPVDNKFFTIDISNGFNNWGNDDKYLINWVKEQLYK